MSDLESPTLFVGADFLRNHRIKPVHWFSLPVVLEGSDNPYLDYPAQGVIRICEQGTNLSVISAIFHVLGDDGVFGPAVEVRNPRFRYAPAGKR